MNDEDKKAFEKALDKALSNSSDPNCWNECDELTFSADDPKEHLEIYHTRLNEDISVEQTIFIGQQIDRFHEEWMSEDSASHIESLQSVFSLSSGHDWAFQRLTVVLTIAENWNNLFGIYDLQIQNKESKQEKSDLLEEAFQLAKDLANDRVKAADYLNQKITLSPNAKQEALLEKLLLKQNDYGRLIELWKRRVPSLSSDEKLDLLLKIASSQEEHTKNYSDAVSTLREYFSICDHRTIEEGLSLSRRMIASESLPENLRKGLSNIVIGKLTELDREHDSIDILLSSIPVVSPQRAFELHNQIADHYSKNDDKNNAQHHLSSALILQPQNKEALDALSTIYGQTNDAIGFNSALVKSSDQVTTASSKVTLLRIGANALVEQNLKTEAIQAYSDIIVTENISQYDLQDVSAQLESLLDADIESDTKIATYTLIANHHQDTDFVRSYTKKAADVHVHTGNEKNALMTWEKYLENHPNDIGAINAVIPLLQEEKEKQLRYLTVLCEVDKSSRQHHMRRLAKLHESIEGNQQEALLVRETIAGEFPQLSENKGKLNELYQSLGQWEKLNSQLESSSEQKIESLNKELTQLGKFHLQNENNPIKAFGFFKTAFQIQPHNQDALEGLKSCLVEESIRIEVGKTLETFYRSEENFNELYRLKTIELEQCNTPLKRRSLLSEAIALSKHTQGVEDEAFNFCCELLPLNPHDNELLDHLLSLNECLQRPLDTVAAIDLAFEGTKDSKLKRELCQKARQLLSGEEGTQQLLRENLAKWVNVDPWNNEAWNHLFVASANDSSHELVTDQICWGLQTRGTIDEECWSVLVKSKENKDNLSDLAKNLETTSTFLPFSVRAQLLKRLATWHSLHIQDNDESTRVLSEAIKLNPENIEWIEDLADLQRQTESVGLLDTVDRLINMFPFNLDLRYESIELAEKFSKEPSSIVKRKEDFFQSASLVWNGSIEGAFDKPIGETCKNTFEDLKQEYTKEQDYKNLLGLLTRSFTLPFSRAEKQNFRTEAAYISSTHGDDRMAAIDILESVLRDDPTSVSALETLSAIYGEEKDTLNLFKIKHRLLDNEESEQRKCELRIQINQLLSEINRNANPLSLMNENLEKSPGHVESISQLLSLSQQPEYKRGSLTTIEEQIPHLDPETQSETRRECLKTLGDFYFNDNADPQSALKFYKELTVVSEDPKTIDDIANIYLTIGQANEALPWLIRSLPNQNKEGRQKNVEQIISIYLEQEQIEDAIKFLSEEIDLRPESSNSYREKLLGIYETQNRWEDFASFQTSSLDFTADSDQKLKWARSSIAIFTTKLNRPQHALKPAQVASELSGDIKDKVFYSETLRLNGDVESAEHLINGLLDSDARLKSREKAQLFFERGNISRHKGDNESAFNNYSSAIKLDASNPNILLAMATSSIDHGNLPKGEKYLKQLLMLTRRSKATTNDQHTVSIPEVLYELHHVAIKKDEIEKAEELLESAFDEVLEQPAFVDPFLNTLENRGDDKNFIELLNALIKPSDDNERRTQHQFKLAQALYKDVSTQQEASELLYEIIGQYPEQSLWVDMAQKWSIEQEHEEMFCEKLLEWGEACKFSGRPQLASKLVTEAAKLMEFEIGRAAVAKNYYIEALTSEPNHLENWLSLARIYDIENQPEEEISALEQVIDLQGLDKTDPSAILKIANHYADHKEQTSMALHYVDSAIKRGLPSHHAYPVYENAVRNGDRSQNLIDAYIRFAESEQSESLMASALRHQALSQNGTMASVEEYMEFLAGSDLDDDSIQQSIAVYEKAATLATESEDVKHRWVFEGLVEAQLDNNRLLEARDSLVTHKDQIDLKRHTEFIIELVDKTENNEKKLSLLESFWNDDQTNSSLWQRVIQLHTENNNIERCDDIIQSILLQNPSSNDEEILKVEQARIKLKRGQDEEAIDILKQAISDSPGNLKAVELYEMVLARPGNEEALADHLKIRFDDILESDDANLIEIEALRIGTLYQATDIDAARHIYAMALRKTPNSPSLLKAVISSLPEETDIEIRADYGERLLHFIKEEEVLDLSSELVRIREALEDKEAVKHTLELAYKRCPQDLRVIKNLENHHEENCLWQDLLELKLHVSEQDGKEQAFCAQKLIEAASIATHKMNAKARGEEILARAKSFSPDNLNVLIAYSDALAQNNKIEEASDVLDQAIPLCTDDSQRHSLEVAHSNLKSLRGEHDVAIVELRELKEQKSDLTIPVLIQALERKADWAQEQYLDDIERECVFEILDLQHEAQMHIPSRQLLSHWLERNPDDVDGLLRLKNTEIAAENWKNAIPICEKLCHILEGEVQLETAIQLANSAALIEEPELALSGLEATYAKQPENEHVRGLLRTFYTKKHSDRELAELLLMDAEYATSSTDKYDKLRNAADIFMNRLGDASAALEPANQAKDIKPDDHETLLMLTDLMIVSGKLDEAIDMLSPAIASQKRRTPALATLQHRMAKIYEAQENSEERLEWLKKAFSVDRKNGYIAAELAQVATERGDYDLALRPLRAISMMKNPEPISKSQALLWEAKIEHAKGNTSKAMLWTKKALREEPEFAEAQEFLDQLS